MKTQMMTSIYNNTKAILYAYYGINLKIHQIHVKMVCIRQATMTDLLQMQQTNLLCLPENYQLKVRK